MINFAYIPGDVSDVPSPLARYLPLVPTGIAATFLERYSASSAWVFDPFGAAPFLDVEMAQAGRNVLVSINNPISRFLLELAAAPPKVEELRAALSQLASLRKGEERLETHLQSLYLTDCSKCGRQVPAEAFIWEKGEQAPSGRIYHCPCGEGGEFETTEADKNRAVRIATSDALHRARALERVTSPDDPDRDHAELALDCYLPRAIYALITLINKYDAIQASLSKELRRAMLTLLLAACDDGNSLWDHPSERTRPKQLVIPQRFLEKNIWGSMENAVLRWELRSPVLVSEWEDPFQADGVIKPIVQGGIYLFDGPARDIGPALKSIQPEAVVTVLPRPNQAFWTLSALWTGWLWGKAAAATFKVGLRRRRYDWNWHSKALHASLGAIATHIPLNAPLFAIMPEPEPAFLTAALAAASEAGFDLDGLALRSRGDCAQILWRRQAFIREDEDSGELDQQAMQEAVRSCLLSRAEATPYLHLHAACLSTLAASRSLHRQDESITPINKSIQEALSHPDFFHHSDSPIVETGLWGINQWEATDTLSDRVEISLIRHLQKAQALTVRELENMLNTEFPGLLTPSPALTQAILDSYAVESAGTWSLPSEDTATSRQEELDSARQALVNIASALGFSTRVVEKPGQILQWLEDDVPIYTYHVITSAVTGRVYRTAIESPGTSVLVLPERRLSLIAYKLSQDPSLRKFNQEWGILRFEQLQVLSRHANLKREKWANELKESQLVEPEQMKLF